MNSPLRWCWDEAVKMLILLIILGVITKAFFRRDSNGDESLFSAKTRRRTPNSNHTSLSALRVLLWEQKIRAVRLDPHKSLGGDR